MLQLFISLFLTHHANKELSTKKSLREKNKFQNTLAFELI